MKKEKKILVTAHIKNSKINSSTILLTTFCNSFDINDYYKNQKLLCANYHWNSKKKFLKDEAYLLKVYEVYLKRITLKLNQIHNTYYSVDYWRIIIGPWLFDFITIIFDRSEIVNYLKKRYKITEVRSAFYKKKDAIFNDYEEFNNFLGKKDNQFNNIIFSELIKFHTKISIKKFTSFGINEDIQKKNSFINFFQRTYNFICRCFIKSTDIFIINSYFKKFFNFRLQIKLGQMPIFWKKILSSEQKIKWKLRKFFNEKNNDEFFSMLNYFIPNFIPKIYLEGYKEAVKLINNLPWQKNPKAIISANSYFLDDVFKIWAAEKKLGGSNLIATQHGGNHFSARINSNEIHLKKICDYILTWGHQEYKNKSIIPFFNFKSNNKKVKHSKFGNLLLFDYIMPKYVEMLQSTYNGPQNIFFLDAKIAFLKKLKNNILNKTFVRNKNQYFDTLLFERKLYNTLNINLNYSSKDFYQELKKSRISVCNSNQTVFLETLNLNFPTIVLFDTKFDELNKTAIPYYNILKENKIFFENPVEAAIHINNIWENVDYWWKSKKAQNAINLFCRKFSKRKNSFKLHQFLNKLDFKESSMQLNKSI